MEEADDQKERPVVVATEERAEWDAGELIDVMRL